MKKKTPVRTIRKTEKEKEIKELKKNLSQEEVNSLEQMIKDEKGKVNLSELQEFLSIKDNKTENSSSSPSLKKINTPQRNPVILERDLMNGPMLTDNKGENEEGGFKYLPNGTNAEEAKYVQYEGKAIESIVPRREIEKINLKGSAQRRDVKFESSIQQTNPAQESFEKYNPVGRLDKEKNLAKNPFERKEVKYTPERR